MRARVHFRFREGLHGCCVGDEAFFLDAESGRYLKCPERFFGCVRAILQGHEPSAVDAPELADMLERGWIIASQSGALEPVAFPVPTEELDFPEHERSGLSELVAVCLAQASSNILVKRLRFPAIVQKLNASQRFGGGIPWNEAASQIRRAAISFSRAEPLFPRKDRCLSRAIAFVSICNRFKVHPSIAIGIRTAPFSAHCWVQQGDVVLNDTLENVRPFTPIMVL